MNRNCSRRWLINLRVEVASLRPRERERERMFRDERNKVTSMKRVTKIEENAEKTRLVFLKIKVKRY